MSESASARRFEPQVWYFLFALFFSLVASLFGLMLVLSLDHGWDARTFCIAAQVAQAGGNPYDVRQLGQELSWNYQPYTLLFLQAVCQAPFPFVESYPFIYGALLLAGVAVLRPGSAWPLAFTLALGAFGAFAWVLLTGNLSAVELLLVSAAVLLGSQRRWEWAGLCLGLLGSLKLVTLAYAALLAFIPGHSSRRLRPLVISLLAFAGTFALSAAIFPGLMRPFFEQVLGLIPGQHNVWIESGPMNNLTLAFFLMDVLKLLGLSLPLPLEVAVGTALAAMLVLWLLGGSRFLRLARSDYPAFFSLGLIAITLLLPRLKPYSFLLLIPPLFTLLRSSSRRVQAHALLISTAVPGLLLLARFYSLVDDPLMLLFLNYSPTIWLIATLVLLVRFLPVPGRRFAHA